MRMIIALLVGSLMLAGPASAFTDNPFKKAEKEARRARDRVTAQAERTAEQAEENARRAEQDVRHERKRVEDDVLPGMKSYCVTYTSMSGPRDEAGRVRIRYNTIHVRGGRDFAKTRAYGKYGEKNVKKIDNRPCSQVYT